MSSKVVFVIEFQLKPIITQYAVLQNAFLTLESYKFEHKLVIYPQHK